MMTTMMTTTMTATMVNTMKVFAFYPTVAYTTGTVLVAACNAHYAKKVLDSYIYLNTGDFWFDSFKSHKDFTEPKEVEGLTFNEPREKVILYRVTYVD